MNESLATLKARLTEDYLHPEVRAAIERKIGEKLMQDEERQRHFEEEDEQGLL